MTSPFAKIAAGAGFLGLAALIIFLVFRCTVEEEYREPFTKSIPNGWTVEAGPLGEQWEWTENGIGRGKFWGNTQPISSESRGGAVLFDSDALDTLFDPQNLPVHFSRLESPIIRATQRLDEVYFRFYQFYRDYTSTGSVEIYGDTDADRKADTWIDITSEIKSGSNPALLGGNVSTSNRDIAVFNISQWAARTSGVRVRFTFEGTYYFWMIDDVYIGSKNPYQKTIPESIGDTLFAKGRPYAVDSLGGVYIPNQYYVNLADSNIIEYGVQNLKAFYRPTVLKTCPCNPDLELWELDPNIQLYEEGDTTPPRDPDTTRQCPPGNIGTGNTCTRDMGGGNNYYVISPVRGSTGTPNAPLVSVPPGVPLSNGNAIIIAILDSGVDYNQPDLVRNIWRRTDWDSGCSDLSADSIGWNFVDNNNNPYDNSSSWHGTIIAKIIQANLANTPVDYRIMPVKTQDAEGIGTLFDNMCGISYAMKNGADIINMSWGWYGVENPFFENILRVAARNNIILVAAAGNHGRQVGRDSFFVYPACSQPEIITTVAALRRDPETGNYRLAQFSNFNNEFVDVAALGEDLEVLGVCAPSADDLPSGTSFAAPLISAWYAKSVRNHPEINTGEERNRRSRERLTNCITTLPPNEESGSVHALLPENNCN